MASESHQNQINPTDVTFEKNKASFLLHRRVRRIMLFCRVHVLEAVSGYLTMYSHKFGELVKGTF